MTAAGRHPRSPAKPPAGDPCNGCGLCCAAEPCPLGILLFRKLKGACPGLGWDEVHGRHVCRVLADPATHLRWIPASLGRRLAFRWIGAGIGCDSVADPE